MLAYSSDSVLKFRDEKAALPTNLQGWVGERDNKMKKGDSSWNLTCEASSSEEEDENEEEQNINLSPVDWIQNNDDSIPQGGFQFLEGESGDEMMNIDNNFQNRPDPANPLGLGLGDENGDGDGGPLFTIHPAEHNTIVNAEEQISQPWASLFRNYEAFNAVQSACFNVAACSDENMIVSAPTGCGKTVLFEFAILRLL